MSRFDTTGTIFADQLARRYVAPPVPADEQQIGPLSAAYAATLNKQRLNGSVTNPMTMNGAAAGSPFNAAITLAKPVDPSVLNVAPHPVQTPTQAQMMFESPEDTRTRQAATAFESPTQTDQRQAAEFFANSQPAPAPTQTMGDDVAAAVAPKRHVEVIRGGVKSGFDWGDDNTQGVETLADGTVVPSDYAGRAAIYGYDANGGGAGGGVAPVDRGGRGWIGQYTHDMMAGATPAFAPQAGNPLASARGRQAATKAPAKAVPPDTLASALAGLSPETINQLHAFKMAGASDEQVIAKAIQLGNRRAPAAPKPTSFSAGTQQDRYIVAQAQKRIRELDAKVRVDPRMGDWAEPKKLTPQEQQEYDGLKATVAVKAKAIAAFDGSGGGGQTAGAGPVTIDTPEEFAALPSGAAYIDKQTGKRGRKP